MKKQTEKNLKVSKKGRKPKSPMESWDTDKFYNELNNIVGQITFKLDKLPKFSRKRTIKEIPLDVRQTALVTSLEVINRHLEKIESQISGDVGITAVDIRHLVESANPPDST